MNLSCEFTIHEVLDGVMSPELARMLNTTMYEGYDLLASMATSEKYINGMYIEFDNSGSPTDPSPVAATRARSYYEALEDAGYAGDLGYVRVPITLPPQFSSTGGNYQSNKASLVAVTDPVTASKNDVIDGTTEFFTVALVHIADIDDPTQDEVYNVAVIKNSGVFSPILKAANIQVGITASVQFEETP